MGSSSKGKSKQIKDEIPVEKLETSPNKYRHNADMKSKHKYKESSSSDDEIEEGENNTIGLSDLDPYCLEKVFNHLYLRDLMNVAETCEYFNQIAANIYKRRYSQQEINVNTRDIYIDYRKDVLVISELERFLSIFGSLITKIHIHYGRQNDKKKSFHHCLPSIFSRNSMKSLKYIRLVGFPKDCFIMFIGPLPSVHEVHFKNCFLDDNITFLSSIFPNMQRLSLTRCRFSEQNQIAKHYPHLIHLELELVAGSTLKSELKSLIHLNPQLEVLSLENDCKQSVDWRVIGIIAEKLKQLHTFNLSYYSLRPKKSHFHFKNVKSFSYINYKCNNNFPFSFKELCELKLLHSFNRKLMNKVINSNKNLVKLSFDSYSAVTEPFDGNISESFSKLQEFDLHIETFGQSCMEYVVSLLQKINRVPKISLEMIYYEASSIPACEFNEVFLAKIKQIPWWNVELQKYRFDSLSWHYNYVLIKKD